MIASGLRIAALYTHPIQYFAPLSRALARAPAVEFLCLFCAASAETRQKSAFGVPEAWGISLVEGYASRTLKNFGTGADYGRPLAFINPGVVSILARGKFDVLLLHGYKSITHLLALLTAKLLGIRVFLRSDAQPASEPAGRPIRRRLLATLYSMFDGILCIGTRSRAYYKSFGVADARLHFVAYAVDNDAFRQRHAMLRGDRAELRRRWHVPDDACCFVFVGRLAPEKNVATLIAALAAARAARLHLLVVGDGTERRTLEELARSEGVAARVSFAGFLDQIEICAAYTAADVFVLPSTHEPWGLVVNEAMNFALPILASDAVGCVDDLVRHDHNGRTLPAKDVSAWSAAMTDLALDSEVRRAYGAASRELIDRWSIEHAVTGLLAAVKKP